MEKRDKVFRRKGKRAERMPQVPPKPRQFPVTFSESQTKLKNDVVRKDVPRPRSRSVYTTNSYLSDDSSGAVRDYSKYEGSPWLPRQLSHKNLYLEDYGVSFDGVSLGDQR